MLADTETLKIAKTDTESDILAEILADTDTETDNIRSLVKTNYTFQLTRKVDFSFLFKILTLR
jgi:hypothetical protein